MKVSAYNLEVHCYSQSLSIEREGETYSVKLSFDEGDGYTLRWKNSAGVKIDTPEWAKKLEDESGDALGLILEEKANVRV